MFLTMATWHLIYWAGEVRKLQIIKFIGSDAPEDILEFGNKEHSTYQVSSQGEFGASNSLHSKEGAYPRDWQEMLQEMEKNSIMRL